MLFLFGGRGGGAALYRWEGISTGEGMKGRMGECKVRQSPAARAAEAQTGVCVEDKKRREKAKIGEKKRGQRGY